MLWRVITVTTGKNYKRFKRSNWKTRSASAIRGNFSSNCSNWPKKQVKRSCLQANLIFPANVSKKYCVDAVFRDTTAYSFRMNSIRTRSPINLPRYWIFIKAAVFGQIRSYISATTPVLISNYRKRREFLRFIARLPLNCFKGEILPCIRGTLLRKFIKPPTVIRIWSKYIAAVRDCVASMRSLQINYSTIRFKVFMNTAI